MRNKIVRNQIIAYLLTFVCFIVFCLTVVSKPTAVAIVRAKGENYENLTVSYNTDTVKDYCEKYRLYSTENTATDTEHIFAQSWENEKSFVNDYFNLRTANKTANNMRGDYGYDYVEHTPQNEIRDNGVLVGWRDTDKKTFEPLDEYKGDVARTLLYIYYNYGLSKKDVEGKFKLKTMVKWAKCDKVSKEEKKFAERVKKGKGYTNVFITNEKIIDLF